jgi:NDP-sugar pyrophosphorylase family protein
LAQKYPDIKVTHTIAGGGPYDIGESYSQFIEKKESTMPSTVISSVLSFNEFFSMGVNYADVFKEDMLNIPNLLLSKEYKRSELDGTKIPQDLTKLFKDAMFDVNSDLSKKFMATFEKDNLCSAWTPRGTERITLVHNEKDGCVPYANATKMADYFEKQGFTVDRGSTNDRYVDGKIFLNNIKIGDGAVIGAGSVVISNVKPGRHMFGNPAKKL